MILFPVKNRNFEMSHFFCRQPPLAEYPASASLESSSPITNPPPDLGFKEACLILSWKPCDRRFPIFYEMFCFLGSDLPSTWCALRAYSCDDSHRLVPPRRHENSDRDIGL